MLDYIIGFIVFYFFYDKIKFFINKRKVGKVPVIKGAEPRFFKGTKKTGLLLLHGLTSSPQEMQYMFDYFKKKDYTVYAPLMPGHGTIPEDLAQTTWQDWVNSSEKALEELNQHVSNVIMAGSSNGGNVALYIASHKSKVQKHNIKGVISISTPVVFRRDRLIKTLLPILKIFEKNQRKFYFRKKDRKLMKSKIHYKVLPLKSVSQCLKLIKTNKQRMHKISLPVLVLNTDTDYQLGINNGDYIYDSVASKIKEKYLVHNAYHVIVYDSDSRKRLKIFRAAEQFMHKLNL